MLNVPPLPLSINKEKCEEERVPTFSESSYSDDLGLRIFWNKEQAGLRGLTQSRTVWQL